MLYCASAIIFDDSDRILAILQGKPGDIKTWYLPGGTLEENETIEECCIREVWEETGFNVELVEKAFIKVYPDIKAYYFLAEIVGGSATIQDPCGYIYEIAWKTREEFTDLTLSFPENREQILTYFNRKVGY